MKKTKEKYSSSMKKHAKEELKTFEKLASNERSMQKKMGVRKSTHPKKSGY